MMALSVARQACVPFLYLSTIVEQWTGVVGYLRLFISALFHC